MQKIRLAFAQPAFPLQLIQAVTNLSALDRSEVPHLDAIQKRSDTFRDAYDSPLALAMAASISLEISKASFSSQASGCPCLIGSTGP